MRNGTQVPPDAGARPALDVRVKRIYTPPDPADGYRTLVDRLWPRGVARVLAELDAWDKHLAPTPELRRWFDHDPARFAEFRRRYMAELREQGPRLEELRHLAAEGPVTLVYGARDTEHNGAVVLAEVLRDGG